MDPAEVYRWLMQGADAASCSGFDAHVLASVLALCAIEAKGEGQALVNATGLEPAALLGLVREKFPAVAPMFERAVPLELKLDVAEDELCLRDLLSRTATEQSPFELVLARIIARRCQRPNHLWQDLGLRNRRELSWLMERHFARLSQRNANDMKWKKFLYRVICREEGYSICTAPSCSECSDFENCFGDESGESLLAKNRREHELGANVTP